MKILAVGCVHADMHMHTCEHILKLITENMWKMQRHISLLYILASSFYNEGVDLSS